MSHSESEDEIPELEEFDGTIETVATKTPSSDTPSTTGKAEQTEDNDNDASPTRVPVTVITGFLGAGKTTLLNYILTAHHGKRIAVIENEFGEEIGVEGLIAKNGSGEFFDDFYELNNGCICCTVKDDLVTTLENLMKKRSLFDFIFIETTGLANPGM